MKEKTYKILSIALATWNIVLVAALFIHLLFG